jgi:acyl-CoA reductase-like NAD-dependent aldehyde dehydrogenase
MTYRTVNPATGETVATFADISDVELDEVLATARSSRTPGSAASCPSSASASS